MLGISLSAIFLTLAFRFIQGFRDNSPPRRPASFRRFDERDLSVCSWNHSRPVADLNKEQEDRFHRHLKMEVKLRTFSPEHSRRFRSALEQFRETSGIGPGQVDMTRRPQRFSVSKRTLLAGAIQFT